MSNPISGSRPRSVTTPSGHSSPTQPTAEKAQAHLHSDAKPQKPRRLPKPAQSQDSAGPQQMGGSEQMAVLNERIPNLRQGPTEARALQEFPPPPPLGVKAGKLRHMIAGEFEKLAEIQEAAVAATRLGTHVAALKTAITKLVDPLEQSVLLTELEFHLSTLPAGLKQTTQWSEAFNPLNRQLHPEVERTMRFKNQTSNFLATLTSYLEKKSADYNPDRFRAIAPQGLAVQMTRITGHKPEVERYELLVHLAQTLSDLAQSDAAREHPSDKLWMSAFIKDCIEPAATAMSATGPHNQASKAALQRLLPLHRAEVHANSEPGIRSNIESAFAGDQARLTDACVSVVKAIGAAPLKSAQKKQLIDELNAKLAPFVDVARGPTPDDDPTLKMLVKVWNAISSEQANNRSWPDLSDNALLMLHLNWAKQWEGKIS